MSMAIIRDHYMAQPWQYISLRIQTPPDGVGLMVETSHPQNRNIGGNAFRTLGPVWILRVCIALEHLYGLIIIYPQFNLIPNFEHYILRYNTCCIVRFPQFGSFNMTPDPSIPQLRGARHIIKVSMAHHHSLRTVDNSLTFMANKNTTWKSGGKGD